MRKPKFQNCYLVINPITHGGFSMRGDSPEHAARRALKHGLGSRTFAGSDRIRVDSFAGGPVGKWLFDVAELG